MNNVPMARAVRAASRRCAQCRHASSSSRAPKPRPKRQQPPIAAAYKPRTQPRTTEPPPPPPEPETLLTNWRRSWIPLTGAALVAGFFGFYIVGTVAASYKQCPCTGEHSTPTGRPPAMTGDNAEQFDKELNMPEWWMGITKLRRRLAERSHGDVLELAMGTGRNLEYYDWAPLATYVEQIQKTAGEKVPSGVKSLRGITSFTGLDISVDMLDVARRKLTRAVPPMTQWAPIVKASSMAGTTGGQLSFIDDRLRLIQADAHDTLPKPPTSAKYDTIVQTFGLCSVADPVAVVQNLATVVKPDTGRIILLEHGQGWYGLVNGLLDKNAVQHFDKYGCWWNRDIHRIVDEAAEKTPGLEVVSVERPNISQLGTLVWVELRMRTSGDAK